MITHRPASLADAPFFAANLRSEDREEFDAAYGVGQELSVLEESLTGAIVCKVAELDGAPFALYGLNPGPDGFKIPWLIGTSVLDRQRRFLCGHFRTELQSWAEDKMFNRVLAKHTKTIRWLQWLGFSICDAEPHGQRGELFHIFYQVKQPCVGH